MAMYFLAQGGEVTGPFGEGRLREKWEQGDAGGDDQVAAAGTEDWFPLSILIDTLPELESKAPVQQVAKIEKKRPFLVLSSLLGLVGIFLLFVGIGIWAVNSTEADKLAVEGAKDLEQFKEMIELEPVAVLQILRDIDLSPLHTASGLLVLQTKLSELESQDLLREEGPSAMRSSYILSQKFLAAQVNSKRATSTFGGVLALVGVGVILLSVLTDRKRFISGSCGSRVEKTATVCPACQARLTRK